MTVIGGQKPVLITVSYPSQDGLKSDYFDGLKSSAMTIQDPALEELYLPVEIQFTLPDGQTLNCKGQTVARTSKGTAMALELDGKQRKILADSVGA